MPGDVSFLLALILLNGVFAMSEIAVVSSRRLRLQQLAAGGKSGAARALALSADPTRFLSTVQVGITSIGILSGAIGEATIARRIQAVLEPLPLVGVHAEPVSLGIMVLLLTYVSLILGELVPKRIGMTQPEAIASFIALPMQVLARVGRPIVFVLSASTDAILRLLRVGQVREPAVTVEELRILLQQGTDEGVIERTEQELVGNVLRLDEQTVSAILMPRSEVAFIDVRDSVSRVRELVSRENHSVLPLCDGGLDHVIGFVRPTDVLARMLSAEPLDLRSLALAPLFVPGSTSLMRLLEEFRRTRLPVALVIDEHGGVDGLVSMADVVAAIVGEPPPEPGADPLLVQREDGSWLVDGRLGVDVLARAIGGRIVDDDDSGTYHTVGGLSMSALERVPKTGDVFAVHGFRFEIVDMDGHRVDRVLVRRI